MTENPRPRSRPAALKPPSMPGWWRRMRRMARALQVLFRGRRSGRHGHRRQVQVLARIGEGGMGSV